MTRDLPRTANVIEFGTGAKLEAPAAHRNMAALCALLRGHAPTSGRALEIASGTGQHVTAFARLLPDVMWHPTDIDPTRLDSIDAYAKESSLLNIAPARGLDAIVPGWHLFNREFNLIVVVNLLHLISIPESQALIAEAAKALARSGKLFIYGPFKRDGALTSAGDARFDAELRASDPTIGYKNDESVRYRLTANGLRNVETVEMPANNLAFIARR